jgi:hypothetical protein
MRGADKKEKMPLIPITSPFMRNVWSGNVLFSTFMMGIVKRPHEKYSKNITTKAWYTDGSPMPELCNYEIEKGKRRKEIMRKAN